MPSYDYKNAWKPIFDIAGSQLVRTPEYLANSYLAMKKYASLIRVADRYGYYPYPSYLDGVKQDGKVRKDYSDVDFFTVYNRTSDHPS
ncbi:MAG: hypothetical protein GXP45_04825 [bacterium]|nr:hypothetical protein [bacterium]